MTNTPSPTDEDRELIRRLRRLYIMDEVGSDNPLGRNAADRLESLLSDRAKLEEALLAGSLSMTGTQIIADFDTRENAEVFYERLALVLINRS